MKLMVLLVSLLFAVDENEKERIHKAAHVTPHPRQLAWQEIEFQAFIHFGVNTFTDREWGEGKEDPVIFDPSGFDADQWVEAFKAAGMKGLVLTAKHHDGFCLWPSRYTDHSVKSSPWKEGKGDLVREVAAACQEAGLKFGIYLSPWDRHEATYGDSPRYNAFFRNQLTELLTQYGPVSEVWFDGACGEGPNGKRQEYDWPSYFEVIRKLQPDAVISIMGPDVRWCGNEAGHTRKSEWSVVPVDFHHSGEEDLGSRKRIEKAQKLRWFPAQVNTSIRPGWFYHPHQDSRVKSLKHLLDVYFGSVGGNAQFLLNIPPDRRGLIHENDVARLKEMGTYLRRSFEKNLAEGAKAEASAVRQGDGSFAPSLAVDGNKNTYWIPEDWTESAWIRFDLPGETRFNCAMLQEYIRKGQRVESFVLEAWIKGQWKEIARSTVIGYKRLLRFDEVIASKIRITFLHSRVCPTLSEFGLYRIPMILSTPLIRRDREGMVSLTCSPPGPEIRYTLDNSTPTERSPRYAGPFPLPSGGMVKARAFAERFEEKSAVSSAAFDICHAKWRVIYVDSEEKSAGEGADHAIDGDPRTIWHTEWRKANTPQPHEIQIDFGEELELKGFSYLPRQNGVTNGTIFKFEFYAGLDGKEWGDPVLKGEFANVANNPVLQKQFFSKPVTARFIRLKSLEEVNGRPWTSVAELGVISR